MADTFDLVSLTGWLLAGFGFFRSSSFLRRGNFFLSCRRFRFGMSLTPNSLCTCCALGPIDIRIHQEILQQTTLSTKDVSLQWVIVE